MKAAVLTRFQTPLTLEDLPLPEPGPEEVLLEVHACGLCHSDLHIVDGDLAGFRARTRERLTPGHEAVGRVVRCGSAVRALQVGDRIGIPWLYRACGRCEACREGNENLCRDNAAVTGMTVNGGFAQYMCAHADYAVAIPEAIADEQAAPLLCAGVTTYRALRKAAIRSGERVAVFGVGGLGHLAVQIARAMDARVFAVDVGAEKLALARELGAEQTLEAADPQLAKSLRALGGMHAAVVTATAASAYAEAVKVLRPGGTLCVVGLPSEPLQFQALALVGGETHIVGTAVGTRADLRAVLALAAAGKLHCRVEVRTLTAINEAIDQLRRGQVQGRLVIDPRR